ncbi:TlpA disulfide reductase family protein [Streptomyces sp. GC420]|uniref:TlpA family protein disulfide reductase n=1 Tax=Streptomyces sp. GC420 TaxID=2697568 RepID=UPI001414FF52|nr:TlpA disulfide reductase family protein [Streptomyces sp. GC420]NBM15409.1 redoxin domain-containing protein [Streptomyces sp. GC420]
MSLGRTPRRRTHRRAAVPAAAVAAGVLALSACGSGGTSGGSSGAGFVTGTGGIDTVAKSKRQDAPELEGETLDGDRLSTADYKGKILVINVWGSWCTPCRAEAPYLAKVAEETEAKGVAFVGINTRNPEKGPALAFEKDFGVGYPSLYDPTGKQLLRFPKGSLNAQAIPSTIVIDRDGKIAARALFALNGEKLHKMIDPLIAEK